jgi:hypothetical protein
MSGMRGRLFCSEVFMLLVPFSKGIAVVVIVVCDFFSTIVS